MWISGSDHYWSREGKKEGEQTKENVRATCFSKHACCRLSSPPKLFHCTESVSVAQQFVDCVLSPKRVHASKSAWQEEQESGCKGGTETEEDGGRKSARSVLAKKGLWGGKAFVCKVRLWRISIQWVVTLHCVHSTINQTVCLQRRSAGVIADARHTMRPLWALHIRFWFYVQTLQSKMVLCTNGI